MRVLIHYAAMTLTALLAVPSFADEPAPDAVVAASSLTASDDDIAPVAWSTCGDLGFAKASAELRQCAMELASFLTHDFSAPLPEGHKRVRVVRGLNLGAACLPYYPAASRKTLEQGVVELAVYVGPDTLVKAAVVVKSSGHEGLDLATARCVSEHGRFEPADGAPAGSWQHMRWTWRFD